MSPLPLICIILVVGLPVSYEHGRMLEPPSRSSAWRVGFPTPRNEDDNQLYCGGFGIQQQNGGKCGICGDAWDDYPRANEAPGGIYATGIITKTYTQGSVIPVVLDITANHQGYFEFKLCPNNDIFFDPTQKCFDRHILKTGKKKGLKYPIFDYSTGIRMLYLHLPKNLNCEQCILQWTYTAGNNWGLCEDGTGAVGCGPQETFRACADIRILKDRSFSLISSESAADENRNAFNQKTQIQEQEFDEYYDDLFHDSDENNIDYNDFQKSIRKYTKKDALNKMSSRKLRLLKRKLLLSMALKSLHNLIIQSKDTSQLNKPEERQYKTQQTRKQETSRLQILDDYDSTVSPWEEDNAHSTVIPWWARSVRHGRRRKRKKRSLTLLQ